MHTLLPPLGVLKQGVVGREEGSKSWRRRCLGFPPCLAAHSICILQPTLVMSRPRLCPSMKCAGICPTCPTNWPHSPYWGSGMECGLSLGSGATILGLLKLGQDTRSASAPEAYPSFSSPFSHPQGKICYLFPVEFSFPSLTLLEHPIKPQMQTPPGTALMVSTSSPPHRSFSSVYPPGQGPWEAKV